MVDVRRAFTRAALTAIAALVTLHVAACGASRERPADAVIVYFQGLASDTASTLLVTSPLFQSRHGIRLTHTPVAEFAGTGIEPAAGDGSAQGGALPEPPPAADPLSPAEIARAQLGWVVLLRPRSFRERAALLAVEIVRVAETDGQAVVETRVTPLGISPFTQRFFLTRKDGTGRWWIDAIEQEDVKIGSRRAAFTAAPSESLRRSLFEGTTR